MKWLETATSDIERGLYTIAVLLLLLLALVVVILVLFTWAKFASLPAGAKVLVGVALGLVFGIVAIIVGWVAEEAVAEAYNLSVGWATHLWRQFDGFTRSNRWVAAILLALLVILMWASWEE